MSKSEVLYVKGMNTSDTDDDEQWDDKKLNAAYDKAVKIANIEVAKRVAMSTNTPKTANDRNGDLYTSKKEKKGKSSMKKDQMPKVPTDMMVDEKPKERTWKPGMHCRLVYSEDGLEYEAIIVRFIDNDDCIVRYLGYNNQEVVSTKMLMPSHGMEARDRQVIEAKSDQPENSYGAISPVHVGDLGSDCMPSPDSMDGTYQKKKKPSKKKKNQARNMNVGFEFPDIPTMPNLSMIRNQLGSSEMPMPPPPMAFATSLDRSDSEEQAISSMLLSWYMSGYYTGLYQGMKRSKEGQGRRN